MQKIKYFIFRGIGAYWMKEYFRAVDALSCNINDWYEKIILAETLAPSIKNYRIKGKNYANKAKNCLGFKNG